MTCMEKLLDAMEDCGEAAAFYKSQTILYANRLFADLFEKDPDECRGLQIVEICHEESIEMIRDFMRRRAHGDDDVPTTYPASFRTAHDQKLNLRVTVIRTENTEGAYLAIFQVIESD